MTQPPGSFAGDPCLHDPKRHREWLLEQARSLIAFFQPRLLNPAGGFVSLDICGLPLETSSLPHGPVRQLHDTTRLVHCFSIAHLLGVPGAMSVVDHGMDWLWNAHRDRRNAGFFWSVDDQGPVDATKQAYGHAFVLLAASSARMVGHPDADRLLSHVSDVITTRFWDAVSGAAREEFGADWQSISPYRGQNANMHLCEAGMAAFEATGKGSYLDMARSIAELIINRHARALGWRVPEHFDENWRIDPGFEGDPMFRPAGITPGHGLEWSRLLVQLFQLGGQRDHWMPGAAASLFLQAVNTGWEQKRGGFFYTLDFSDRPLRTNRFWWPCAEGIGAAHALATISPDPRFSRWYDRIWNFVALHSIDKEAGGWFAELDENLQPVSTIFPGKPDLYHALQACLIPLLPPGIGILKALAGPDNPCTPQEFRQE